MRRALVLITFLMLIFLPLHGILVSGPITGKVTSFNDSTSFKEIEVNDDPKGTFIGYLEIPKRAVVTNASFNVTAIMNSTGNYPKDVFIDVGDDGNYEWGFSGAGYGQMGQQRYFLNNRSYSRLEITGDSYNKTTTIRLPKNATVTSTMMLIDGRANVSGADPSQSWNSINSQQSVKVVANITGDKVYFARMSTTYFDIYDPSSKSWSTSSNCASTIVTTGHGITLAGADIYVGSNNNRLYRYHTNNNTWIDLGTFPSSTTNMAYGGLTYDHADRIYAIQWLWSSSSSVPFYYYAISNSTWVKLKSPLQTACAFPTLCYLENRVYLLNYTQNSIGRELQYYAPNNNTWFRLTDAPTGLITRLCTDNYNLFSATNEGQILKYDVLSDSWAITGKKTSNFISSVGGLAYSDRMFYACRYMPSGGYYNISAVGGGDFPINSSLNIGDNGGLPEWNITGEFNTSDFVDDFTSEMNSLILSTPTSYIDAYGNEFVDIVVNITSNITSNFTIMQMKINYTYTERVDMNPFTGDLVNSLNELIPDTGEGNITIPIVIYTSTFGNLNISNISIDYYIPDLTNNRLELVTGHGPEGKTIYADYIDYTFLVNITNRAGVTDVSNVILHLDADGENLQILWDEATDSFFELYDPKNLITLDALSSSSFNNSIDSWTLEFGVRFDWAYPNETLELCALNTSNDTGAFIYNEFPEIYRVENDLEFVGNLNVTAEKQGILSSKPANDHWVSANEKITWTNLTVVYQDSINFYPDDKNFNVTITDDGGEIWYNTTNSGKSFVIETVSNASSDYNDMHEINITEIPGVGEDVSNWKFLIRTDNDGPLIPTDIACHADSAFDMNQDYDDDTTVYITWTNATDAGAGVQYHAMEYDNQLPTDIKTSKTSAVGEEGLSTFYVRARDNVGNWGLSGSASIFIDLTLLSFTNPTPAEDVWLNNRTVTAGITIQDPSGSGVDINSVQYRVEEDDIQSMWKSYTGPGVSGETLVTLQNITFESDGDDKKVQWRAKDLAGNGWVEQEIPNRIKIDSTPATLEYIEPNLDSWLNSLTPAIKIYINDTGGSGVDLENIEYSISTSGLGGFGPWKKLFGVGGGESVIATVSPTFEEGKLNYIKIRAQDIAGNQQIFEPRQISIDISEPVFKDFEPAANTWISKVEVVCNITISDQISDINLNFIKYSITTNGTGDFSVWSYVPLVDITPGFGDNIYYISVKVTFEDGDDNYIRFSALDLGGNEGISKDYNVKIDITGVRFENAFPTKNQWSNSQLVPCSITLNDTTGSGIIVDSIQYSISTSGMDGFSDWTTEGLELTGTLDEVSEIVHASVTPQFSAGANNYIRYSALDVAGNPSVSTAVQIHVDLEEVIFFNPEPQEDLIYDELELRCRIMIEDIGGSGVDQSSVEYKFSDSGMSGFNDWTTKDVTPEKKGDKFAFFVDLPFKPGNQNHVQWRAKDHAGNGPTESKILTITINSPPIAIIDEPLENARLTTISNIHFNANSSFDPDPNDILTFEWTSNISKYLGNSNSFYQKLGPGIHKITLIVSDNHGHSVTITRQIIVTQYYLDSDGDTQPDYIDTDDDNDGIADTQDAFPLDPKEWVDTDDDGVGNNRDTDDDGDGYLDTEDDYPLNPLKWKKQTGEDYSLFYMLIFILIIVVIIILSALAMVRHRKKKKAELETQMKEIASKLPVTTKTSQMLGTQTTSSGVPLLPSTVSTPSTITPSSPYDIVYEPKPEEAPQQLIRYPEQILDLQPVETYIPPPTQPTIPQPPEEKREESISAQPSEPMADQTQSQVTPPVEGRETQEPTQTPQETQKPSDQPPAEPKTSAIKPGLTPKQQKQQKQEQKKGNK